MVSEQKMATATSDRKATKPNHVGGGAPAPEPEHLPCPRCDSTNTKFCYYNNYNFSQPRHFCKSCRRYWTHGGTLRDIPVGGGSRKNAKRPRTATAAAAAATGGCSTAFPSAHRDFRHLPAGASQVLFQLEADHGGGGAPAFPGGEGKVMNGSFTSLLNYGQGSGLLALGGFGLDDAGFGLGRGAWPFIGAAEGGQTGGGDTWQHENGEGGGYFAISTPGSVFK